MRLTHFDTEHRALTAILVVNALVELTKPAYAILCVPSSWVAKVAGLAFSPYMVGAGFAVAALMLLPLLGSVLLGQPKRMLVKLACLGLASGGFGWFGLAYLARSLNVGVLVLKFLVPGGLSIALAFAFAVILNNQIAQHEAHRNC